MATTPPPNSFIAPVVSRPWAQRLQVAAEAPVALGAEQVVDQAEEGEGEAGEQHHRPQEAVAELLAHPELGQRRAGRLHHQHRQHDHEPAGGGQLVAAVVACAAAPARRGPAPTARSSSSGGHHATGEQQARRR